MHYNGDCQNNFETIYSGKVCLNPCPAEPGYTLTFANSVDPNQLASKPTDPNLHCLPLSNL